MAEGEDLLDAARAAGAEPVELLTAAGEGLGGTEVEPALLDAVLHARLGDAGDRRLAGGWAEWADAPCVYLHGVSDPGNVGSVIRTAHALVGGTVRARAGLRRPVRRRTRCAQAWERVFARATAPRRDRCDPGAAGGLVAHGGEPLEALDGMATLCLGAEREGLPDGAPWSTATSG